MAKVIPFPRPLRAPAATVQAGGAGPGSGATILLFLGVRYEREHPVTAAADRLNDGNDRGGLAAPGRRRGRRRA